MLRRLILLFTTALVALVAAPSVASAYLHLANARSYAQAHVWDTQCGSPNRCTQYPAALSWYQRLSDTQLKVEIRRYGNGYRYCDRIYGVGGSDAAPYINSSTSNPYWVCPAAALPDSLTMPPGVAAAAPVAAVLAAEHFSGIGLVDVLIALLVGLVTFLLAYLLLAAVTHRREIAAALAVLVGLIVLLT